MKINLWDTAFAHVPYSVPGRTSKHIQWCRNHLMWDGITVVTDSYIADGRIFDMLKSRVTIGWLLEGRGYAPQNYPEAEKHLGRMDLLLTHDARLIAAYPDKVRRVPFGGCWIADENWGLHEKTRRVSHIYSAKNFMEGHRLRHEIGRRCRGVDHFGYGTERPLARKEDGLSAYEFSIVVENERAENYFTEKLLDCFAVGTVPIYWGCPNIGDFFDDGGIYQFDTLDELAEMLPHLDTSEYARAVESAARNLETARQYALPEDYMYEHVLKGMDR